MNISYKITLFLITSLLIIFNNFNVFALPGQDLNTVLRWSEKHLLLKKLKNIPLDYQEDYTRYRSSSKYNNLNFDITVYVDSKKKILQEEIRLDQPIPAKVIFERQNNSALNMLKTIYNQSISDDFKNSKLIAQKNNKKEIQSYLYKGKAYIYIVIPDQNPYGDDKTVLTSTFTISPLSSLNLLLKNWNKPPEEEY